MKKLTVLLLVALMLLPFAACNKKGDGNTGDTFHFFDSSFRWDMTVEETKQYIKDHQVNKNEIKVTDYDTWSTVSDGYYTFRFDEKGKIDLINIDLGKDPSMLDHFVEEYGMYENVLVRDTFDAYNWQGRMAGKKCEMELMIFYSTSKKTSVDNVNLKFLPE